MRRFRPFGIVLAFALVLAACGSGSGNEATSTTVRDTATMAFEETTTTTVPEETAVEADSEETTTTEVSTEETTTTTVPQASVKSEEMVSPGDDPLTTEETTTTTTVPKTKPADVCEAPDAGLSLVEQQAACDRFVWSWLVVHSRPAVPLLFLDHQIFVDGESTTLLIRLRSYTITTEAIRASRESVREGVLARFGFPESWMSEEELESMEAKIDKAIAATVQRFSEERTFWFGSIAFAYASYADLLGIDTIVLQIATADTTTDSGWSVVIYGVDAASVADASPMTLSDLLDAINRRETLMFNSIYDAIFNLFEEVALPTGDPVDLYATTDGKEDTDAEDTEG